jgi:ABC-2 type transport system permease protein
MSATASVRKFWATFCIGYRTSTESYLSLVFSLISSAVTLVVLFAVYQSAMNQTGTIHGLSFVATIWSLSMYSFAWAVGTRRLCQDVSTDIKEGTIEVRLARPMSYLAYIIAFRLGKNAFLVAAQIGFIVLALLAIAGFPNIDASFLWFATMFLTFILGTMISTFLYLSVGLIAFWIQDPFPVMWIIDKMVMVLGGSFVPIAFFPSVMRTFAEWSPFGAAMAFSQGFAPDFMSHVAQLLLSQITWVVLLGCLCLLLWKRAQLNVSVNGG